MQIQCKWKNEFGLLCRREDCSILSRLDDDDSLPIVLSESVAVDCTLMVPTGKCERMFKYREDVVFIIDIVRTSKYCSTNSA